ncbi:MAG: hypothetical protein GDA56_21400 [Hormoscilla sp. GM7CHS1pb]|nr:hypothetical protein [Hormoscilla sp. GM7CHS1pb]
MMLRSIISESRPRELGRNGTWEQKTSLAVGRCLDRTNCVFLSAYLWRGLVLVDFCSSGVPEQAADRANMLQAIYEHGNYIEAAIWSILAAVFAVRSIKQSGLGRTWSIVAAFTFFFYGCAPVRDTGYRTLWKCLRVVGSEACPWWLFLWNAACVALMVGLLVAYLRYLR